MSQAFSQQLSAEPYGVTQVLLLALVQQRWTHSPGPTPPGHLGQRDGSKAPGSIAKSGLGCSAEGRVSGRDQGQPPGRRHLPGFGKERCAGEGGQGGRQGGACGLGKEGGKSAAGQSCVQTRAVPHPLSTATALPVSRSAAR